MQALIDIIAGLVAILAAAALSLFGVDTRPNEKPAAEIHRVRDCNDSNSTTLLAASSEGRRNC